jgi:alkylation response protein AidB-like acyl-CoA dehydrogenase
MQFTESEELGMLRHTARGIASRYGHEYYRKESASGGHATELWQDLADHGLMGVNLPEQFGGGGMGITELMVVSEEIAAQGCPLLLMLVSPAICGTVIARYGTPAQQLRYLPPLAQGRKMAFAITEPNAGSNSHAIETTARADGDGYRLRGTKYYISGVDESEQILVVAKSPEPTTGKPKLGLFIVDSNAAGLSADPIPMEIRAPERQFTVHLDDVWVSKESLVGEDWQGLKQVFVGLQPERILGASISNGIGRYALAKAATYAQDRAVWGTPIGAHQGVSHPLAAAKIALELSRLMTLKAAWMYDAGLDAAEAANMAKFASAEAGIEALDCAIQTHGGNGLASEFGLADLWGMARLLRTAPVSREMILNYIAQHSLSLPRSY